MDYLVELASHADLLEAIKLEAFKENGRTEAATSLLLLEFLADEHPNAWTAEVVHAFSADPKLAAGVWVNLRHCARFRPVLAKAALDTLSTWDAQVGHFLRDMGWDKAWTSSKASVYQELEKLVPREYVDAYKTDQDRPVSAYAADLRGRPEDLRVLCRHLNKQPEPPTFLGELMDAKKTSGPIRDRTTQRLLGHPRLVRRWASATRIGVPFSLVLADELDQIRETRAAVHRSAGPDQQPRRRAAHPIRQALDENLLGLAFSGGGIRSATFNLGLTQALAKIGLLKHFDYLSTVSGGGYIGSWLSAWTHRASLEHSDPAAAITELQRRLSPARSPNPMDERVRPIRFLREYSNYLTPRTGFFSADTWTMIGIYVRNTLLNQVIIVSLFTAILLLPRLWYAWTALLQPGRWAALPVFLWGFGAVLLGLNLRRLDPQGRDAMHPPAGDPPDAADANAVMPMAGGTAVKEHPPMWAQPRAIQLGVILPWLLAAALLAPQYGPSALSAGGWQPIGSAAGAGANIGRASLWLGGFIGLSLLVILGLGRSDRSWTEGRPGPGPLAEAIATIVGSAAAAGAVAAGLTWVLLRVLLLLAAQGPVALRWHLNAIGSAGLMCVLSLAIVVQLGMLGERFPDEHREWWSRIRTFVHVYAVAWLAWFAVAMYVPWGMYLLRDQQIGWRSGLTAFAAWIASTVFGVQRGQTAEQDQKQQRETPGRSGGMMAMLLRAVALVAPFVFIAGLVLGIALAINGVWLQVFGVDPTTTGYWIFAHWTAQRWVWVWTAGCVAVGLLFSWRVDINEFSIHHFYKNRLVRCYLGASRTKQRKADWFTGFDPNDDLPLTAFDNAFRGKGKEYPGPYPIVNTALNLVGGQDLAWQERKATSFVFTPKHCGYDVDRAVLTKLQRSEAYVPTKHFYRDDEGPQLGMAMAISGAAANPNMGRASSPASAVLMTVFNVRLGWWMGNPRHTTGSLMAGPRFGLTYTALELFGATDDSRKYVNLSDGGHFDNLGVYELIRRGCRYIVASDAGQDPDAVCEDLGDLVRRCRTDFGVEIEIAVDRIRDRTRGISPAHCVVGKIHYLNIPRREISERPGEGERLVSEEGGPVVRGCRPQHEVGYLVYIKPSMTGDEPQDVLEYSRRIPEFPHQSTADQWFGESQFESYRKLGMHVGEQTFSRYQQDDTQIVGNLQQLFENLHKLWYPPSRAISERGLEHATEYSRIMETVRTDPGLVGLDESMFELLQGPAQSLPGQRDQFYVCNALIQLMENVYGDLDLEQNWNHPHVAGWMKVFRRWAQQPAFRRAWKIAESTYADQFRNFYNDRLRGRPLTLAHSFVGSRAPASQASNPGEMMDGAIKAGAGVIVFQIRADGTGDLVVMPGTGRPGRATAASNEALTEVVTALPLSTCLDHIRGRAQLILELADSGLERQVLDVMRAGKWRDADFVLVSSNRKALKEMRAYCADVRLGLRIDSRDEYDKAFDGFLESDVDFLAPEESMLNDHDLHHAQECYVPLVPWPVNAPDRMQMFLGHSIVAGVITDDVTSAVQVKNEL